MPSGEPTAKRVARPRTASPASPHATQFPLDTGIGIAAADIPRIMEPFAQVREGAYIAHEGTGLGLPISKKLIEYSFFKKEPISNCNYFLFLSVQVSPTRICTISPKSGTYIAYKVAQPNAMKI